MSLSIIKEEATNDSQNKKRSQKAHVKSETRARKHKSSLLDGEFDDYVKAIQNHAKEIREKVKTCEDFGIEVDWHVQVRIIEIDYHLGYNALYHQTRQRLTAFLFSKTTLLLFSVCPCLILNPNFKSQPKSPRS